MKESAALTNTVIKNKALVKPSRLVSLAVFISLGLITYRIEAQFLAGGAFPGVKFGLANIFTLLVLFYFGPLEALVVLFGRVFAASLITGSLMQPAFIFSFAGALASWICVIATYRAFFGIFSFAGISVIGAIAHNLAQLCVASIIVGNSGVWTLMPAFLVSGVFFGAVNGILVNMVVNRVPRTAVRRDRLAESSC